MHETTSQRRGAAAAHTPRGALGSLLTQVVEGGLRLPAPVFAAVVVIGSLVGVFAFEALLMEAILTTKAVLS